MLELIKKRKQKLAEPLAKKELSAEGCCRRNGKWEEGLRQKKISDDRHHDRWTVCRYCFNQFRVNCLVKTCFG